MSKCKLNNVFADVVPVVAFLNLKIWIYHWTNAHRRSCRYREIPEVLGFQRSATYSKCKKAWKAYAKRQAKDDGDVLHPRTNDRKQEEDPCTKPNSVRAYRTNSGVAYAKAQTQVTHRTRRTQTRNVTRRGTGPRTCWGRELQKLKANDERHTRRGPRDGRQEQKRTQTGARDGRRQGRKRTRRGAKDGRRPERKAYAKRRK